MILLKYDNCSILVIPITLKISLRDLINFIRYCYNIMGTAFRDLNREELKKWAEEGISYGISFGERNYHYNEVEIFNPLIIKGIITVHIENKYLHEDYLIDSTIRFLNNYSAPTAVNLCSIDRWLFAHNHEGTILGLTQSKKIKIISLISQGDKFLKNLIVSDKNNFIEYI